MIHVIATISLVPESREEFLTAFRENVPNVLAEAGCRQYEPVVDVDAGLPVPQALREDVVTVIEQWESLEALHAHLAAPHMAAYRERVQGLVAGVTLQVMEPA